MSTTHEWKYPWRKDQEVSPFSKWLLSVLLECWDFWRGVLASCENGDMMRMMKVIWIIILMRIMKILREVGGRWSQWEIPGNKRRHYQDIHLDEAKNKILSRNILQKNTKIDKASRLRHMTQLNIQNICVSCSLLKNGKS